jgi:hypothetical protein
LVCGKFTANSPQESTDLAGLRHGHSAVATEDLVALLHADDDRLTPVQKFALMNGHRAAKSSPGSPTLSVCLRPDNASASEPTKFREPSEGHLWLDRGSPQVRFGAGKLPRQRSEAFQPWAIEGRRRALPLFRAVSRKIYSLYRFVALSGADVTGLSSSGSKPRR